MNYQEGMQPYTIKVKPVYSEGKRVLTFVIDDGLGREENQLAEDLRQMAETVEATIGA